MAAATSARVSNSDNDGAAQTPEEEDLLRRSTFKDKEGGLAPTGPRKLVSYKDICTGINGRLSALDEDEPLNFEGFDMEDSDEEEDDAMEDERAEREVDPLCPVIKVTTKEVKEARRPWKLAVIVKLVGKRLGLGIMRSRLSSLWKTSGSMEIIDLAHGYFVVRFTNSEDYQHVFDGGPWTILGHYLMIQRWKPEFIPSTSEVGRVAIWVRIPDFPVEYYGKHFLWRIGESLGKMIKIDEHSMRSSVNEATGRGSFARLCVEVDLRKSLVAKFEFHDLVYKVEYEGLNQICFHCGRFGHRLDSCPLLESPVVVAPGATENVRKQSTSTTTPTVESQPFGEWMIVKRPQRWGKRSAPKKGNQTNHGGNQGGHIGSRFDALAGSTSDSQNVCLEGPTVNNQIIVEVDPKDVVPEEDPKVLGEQVKAPQIHAKKGGHVGPVGKNSKVVGSGPRVHHNEEMKQPDTREKVINESLKVGRPTGKSSPRADVLKHGRAHSVPSAPSPSPVKILTRSGLVVGGLDEKSYQASPSMEHTVSSKVLKTLATIDKGGGPLVTPGGYQAFVRPPEDTQMRQRDATSLEKNERLAPNGGRERERSLSPGASTRPN